MNVLNFNSEQCGRIRRQLDAYLSNELLVETTSDVLRHLESCEACSRELEARTQVRDALRRAAASQVRRKNSANPFSVSSGKRNPACWEVHELLPGPQPLPGFGCRPGRDSHGRVDSSAPRQANCRQRAGDRGRRPCPVCNKGHNYPNVANPPDKLRRQLGPEYAGLLEVVQQKLSGFEVLEAHICSIPNSPRKYVHFITRGRGTILSVILTRREGAQFPTEKRSGQAIPAGSICMRLISRP